MAIIFTFNYFHIVTYVTSHLTLYYDFKFVQVVLSKLCSQLSHYIGQKSSLFWPLILCVENKSLNKKIRDIPDSYKFV